MQFKQTYKLENMKKTIYFYVDNKRVSSDKFLELVYVCKCKGLKYNSSYVLTRNNGRIELGFTYS